MLYFDQQTVWGLQCWQGWVTAAVFGVILLIVIVIERRSVWRSSVLVLGGLTVILCSAPLLAGTGPDNKPARPIPIGKPARPIPIGAYIDTTYTFGIGLWLNLAAGSVLPLIGALQLRQDLARKPEPGRE